MDAASYLSRARLRSPERIQDALGGQNQLMALSAQHSWHRRVTPRGNTSPSDVRVGKMARDVMADLHMQANGRAKQAIGLWPMTRMASKD